MSYKVGIVGGGQLAYMIIEECKKRGFETACLDETAEAPALKICDTPIVGKFYDVASLTKLCEACDVVTYEFENIDCNVIETLSKKYNIMQGNRPLFYSKNRIVEKNFALDNGLIPPKFAVVMDTDSLTKAVEYVGLPAVLKTCTMGYDGKGQMVLRKLADLENVPQDLLCDSILEQFIKFDFEVSCIVVRNKAGEIVHMPIGENIHKNGILDLCLVPPTKLSKVMEEKIITATYGFMARADFVGILAIEYFVVGEEFFFNEMAPRPHNSGHYSIEGCDVSQYGMLVDCLCGGTLRQPKLLQDTFMKNILGQDIGSLKNLKTNKNVHIHMYNKAEAKLNRKMGHVTFTNCKEDEFLQINKKIFGGTHE